ncbi:hypothetical protein DAPPUDRAFT_223830, partial [Daphnia pulex]
MAIRVATLCCFLLLVALATSAKIPPKKGHHFNQSSSKEQDKGSSSSERDSSEEVKLPVKRTTRAKPTTIEEITTTTTTAPTTIQELTTMPTTPDTTPTTEKSLLDFCKSLADGNYVNPVECKTFISCSNQITYIMNCPANLVYNQQFNWCDYSHNVPGCM